MKVLLLKIKKVLRYVRLYGISRTLIKVKSQYHAQKKYQCLPKIKMQQNSQKYIGIIGCGNFAFSNIAYYLQKNYGNVIRGVMDKDLHKAASLYENYNADYYADDAEKIIADPKIELIFVASNHATHADYAIRALQAGKCVHIEKPHAVSEEQLFNLCQVMRETKGKVTLGFNRQKSAMGKKIKDLLRTQTGPTMLNWFVAGHELSAEHWYYHKEEGGRILGNLSHWIDFVYQLIESANLYPLKIFPVRSAQADCGIAVNYIFADGSIAVITFSVGAAFEGVREKLNAQRGDVLVSLSDFQKLTVDINAEKYKINSLFRDQGHEAAIQDSHRLVRAENGLNSGVSAEYVWQIGELMLKTKEALETNLPVIITERRLFVDCSDSKVANFS